MGQDRIIMKNQVLLLSMSYTPLTILPWRKAVNLVIGRNRAEVLSEYIDGASSVFNASVIRLTVHSPDPFLIFKRQKFSKKSTFVRDKFECQYCGAKVSMRDGTLDHILPRSRGGTTSYMNCVTACKPCNSRKDAKTPGEARMPLLSVVRYPNMNDIFHATHIPQEWSAYLGK